VVLPAQEADVVRLRPLTGSDDESIGLFLPLEGREIVPSTFPPPVPEQAGDTAGAMLLLDAARLHLRSGAAPFRSLSRIAVTPRPYQFVPLIMALRLDPVRLLIADDVGVGKTIEAAMVARELLDRGLARRLAVLCPAHLCDQWERELREKFGIEAAVIQPARIARLERDLPRPNLSIYQYYRHLILSIDFVKSERNRGHFLDNAPDLVIVDEAHIATRPGATSVRPQQQRYELLRALADDPNRHLVLVTATPHSGIEESFRSLLGLLDRRFDTDGQSPPPALDRRALVPHLVQRRRDDLAQWLGTETPFPKRDSEERTYRLSAPYHDLFEDVLAYCRETVRAASGLRTQQQRVRHWAAIALLRCVLSSPDAAVAVLSERAKREGLTDLLDVTLADETGEDVDARYRPQVLDPLDDETAGDYVPTAPVEDAEPHLSASERRKLGDFLRRARALAGSQDDAKLAEAARVLRGLLNDGFRPIVFCRFIATAKYLETRLPPLLSDVENLRVTAVTGEIGDEERRAKIDELVREPVRVLVATDCLSEGINLQEHFDAVLHYDLPWNPNRLEQREGRVDRFGQSKPVVKAVLLYGADNPVDQVVLDVLIRKARLIHRTLGVAVPVPADTEQVVQAVVDSVLLRGGAAPGAQGRQLELAFTDPAVSRIHAAWDAAAKRERQQRAYFAQQGIKPDEVARELAAADPVLGDAAAVQRFLANAAQRVGGSLNEGKPAGVYELRPGTLKGTLAARGYGDDPLRVAFDRVLDPTVHVLGRTHPVVAAFADAVLGAALRPGGHPHFARAGAMVTDAVTARTGLLLLRLRYRLHEQVDEFAEEVVLAAFERRDGRLHWLEPLHQAGIDLLGRARPVPVANLAPAERQEQVRWALEFVQGQPEWYAPVVAARVRALTESHARVRQLVNARKLTVEPHTPPDILGCYVLLPGNARGGR
jgi:superfamily II DNA or RNA helicase